MLDWERVSIGWFTSWHVVYINCRHHAASRNLVSCIVHESQMGIPNPMRSPLPLIGVRNKYGCLVGVEGCVPNPYIWGVGENGYLILAIGDTVQFSRKDGHCYSGEHDQKSIEVFSNPMPEASIPWRNIAIGGVWFLFEYIYMRSILFVHALGI